MVKEDSTYENNPIKIGQNASDNDKIITEARQCDIWFHLADFPSCHVVISVSKEYPVTKQMIEYCAGLVKENTKYRDMNRLRVNYCEVKNVQRTDVVGRVILKGGVKSVVV